MEQQLNCSALVVARSAGHYTPGGDGARKAHQRGGVVLAGADAVGGAISAGRAQCQRAETAEKWLRWHVVAKHETATRNGYTKWLIGV